MHLVQDENGSPCPHSHEHIHEQDGCSQTSCDSGCSGCGVHAQGPEEETMSEDKIAALLDYMWKHNEHHAAELDQVADRLRAAGKADAAEQVKKAADEFQKGNLYLGLALSMVKN